MSIQERCAGVVPVMTGCRSEVRGKFLFAGDEKLYIRGVTYGTFRPGEDGSERHDPEIVERDFAQMAANGINAVRTYTVPPRWLLDTAQRHGLRVMVGLPWEQHITFLDGRKRAETIVHRVADGVRSCAGHPAVLCYTIGNEIPSPIVRWHSAPKIERFLERLYHAAKAEDPDGLVTYVNYPSTEYLRLPFVDFACFNVYLETQDRLEAYLARLQNLAGDKPLVMAEIGLDSRRNGTGTQANVLDWQVRTAFGAGCAGIFVFAWTDEWYRGGYDIEDWDFGLVDRQRRPKPALESVRGAFNEAPFPPELPWPRISVVVCSHNGARTIRDTCEGLATLEYPDYEVIVVDDGSTDATASIAWEYDFRVISQANGGLSDARNTGWRAATGEIVAYIDDDARPDSHWLRYLAATFLRTGFVGVGGPNIAPAGDGRIADAVANAPGGPVHVLLSDTVAEHIPGCNMAFRRDALEAVGGFDERYRAAGDDVDMCWRLQERGWEIGFSPAATVWHHRRNSVKTYWKQQKGYGQAEAILEEKWPERYNSLGHISWGGRIYGKGLTLPIPWGRSRIYSGTWGTALFQSVYGPGTGVLRSLPLMPEWYLLLPILAGFSLLGLLWRPLLVAVPLLVVAILLPIIQAVRSASEAEFSGRPRTFRERLVLRALTALLHLMQPAARLRGRVGHGLTPWRRRSPLRLASPWPRTVEVWSETWRDPTAWLGDIETRLQEEGISVLRGGDFDRWDLEARGGLIGSARLLMALEEHGGGKQLARFRVWPEFGFAGVVAGVFLLALTAGALLTHGSPFAAAIMTLAGGLILIYALISAAMSLDSFLRNLAVSATE